MLDRTKDSGSTGPANLPAPSRRHTAKWSVLIASVACSTSTSEPPDEVTQPGKRQTWAILAR